MNPSKIFSVLFFVGLIFWIGSTIARFTVSNELLIMGTLDFKPNIDPHSERIIYSLIANVSSVILFGYFLTWISGIMFLITTDLSFKKNGWIIMSAILFYIFTPVEFYTFYLDIKIILLNYFGSNDLVEYRKLLIHRLAALSGAPFVAILSYFTMIVCIFFQPLKK